MEVGSDAILCDMFTLSPGPSPRGRGVKTTGTAVLPTPVGAGGWGKCLSPTLHHYLEMEFQNPFWNKRWSSKTGFGTPPFK